MEIWKAEAGYSLELDATTVSIYKTNGRDARILQFSIPSNTDWKEVGLILEKASKAALNE